MAVRPTTLALENLESRLNLSTLFGGRFAPVPGFSPFTQERTTIKGVKPLSIKKAAAAPIAPTQLSILARTNSTLQVHWNGNTANATGYHLYRSTDGVHYSLVAKLGIKTKTYMDRHLAAGKAYYYKVSTVGAGGEKLSGAVRAATVGPLAAPTRVGVSSVTGSSLNLHWSDNSTGVSGFRIYRSTNNKNFTLVGNVAGGTFSFADKGLSARTKYFYEVSAWNGTGNLFSKSVTATTLAAPPNAPTNLAISDVTTSGLSLSWRDASPNESGFRVYRSTDGVNYTLLSSLPMNSTSFTDSGLTSGTTYSYEVGAYGGTGQGVSASVSATTLVPAPHVASIPAPLAPTGVGFSGVTSGSITVNWTDSANAAGYHIYRSTDGANFSYIGDLGATATAWTDTGLASSTTYSYVVGAYNSGGEGQSIGTSISTLVAAPGAPSSPSYTNVTSTTATLNWSAPAGNTQSGYHIFRSTDNSHFSVVGTLSADAVSWTDDTLSPSSTYYYSVSAFNVSGEAYSAASAVATAVGAPNAPVVSIASVTSSSVTLNWAAPGNQMGYHIYRSTDGVNYAAVGNASAGDTSWSDSGLSASTTYFYEVGAYNGTGETVSAAVTPVTATPPAPVTVSTQALKSFNELVITGTSGSDSILVTQANGSLTINANGSSYTESGPFGDIKIYGVSGNDSITVDSSVNIATLIYGGTGSDTIMNLTTGKATIVTIGGAGSTVTGNGVNTSFWVTPADVVHATSAETALGGVNRVSGFYQPFSSNPANANYIPTSLLGQNLPDPTDAGAEKRLTTSSFWGTGPTMNDINQGGLSDCYFLAPMSSLAYSEPQKLMNMGVDLGDGTYAVRFVRNGVTSYVRVDGELSTGYYSGGMAYQQPGANGNQWASIFEKAYAFFRTGADTYASLNWGSQASSFSDLGLTSSAISPSFSTANTVLSTINTQLSAGHAIASSTNGTITSGAPLIGSHVYTIIGAYKDSSGVVWIQLRNPWGVDGAGNDGNPSDGLVTINFSMYSANFNSLNYTLA
ncbi:MAG: fibronectin type III domain-containing protein [Phycisphaerae bacterium]